MRPLAHLVAAPAVGAAVFAWTGNGVAAGAAAALEVLLDLDHGLDFLLFSSRPYRWKDLFRYGASGEWGRVMFLGHGFEWLLPLGIVAGWTASPIWGGVFFGVLVHLLMDGLGNRKVPGHRRIHGLFYFITYRLHQGFRVERMSTVEPAPGAGICGR